MKKSNKPMNGCPDPLRKSNPLELEGGQADNDLKVYQGLPDDPTIRMGFVKKVYGILSVQMLVTTTFSAITLSMRQDENVVRILTDPALLAVVTALYVGSMCALVCCSQDKKVPNNYILLGIFTLCMSWLVGTAVMKVQDPVIVVEAAALTFAIVIAITIFAATTKQDFTICGPVLFILFFLAVTV